MCMLSFLRMDKILGFKRQIRNTCLTIIANAFRFQKYRSYNTKII